MWLPRAQGARHLALAVAVLAGSGAAALSTTTLPARADRRGVTLGGVDVGGMSVEKRRPCSTRSRAPFGRAGDPDVPGRFHRRPRARPGPNQRGRAPARGARRESRRQLPHALVPRPHTAAGSGLPRAARRLLAGGRRQDRCRRSRGSARPARRRRSPPRSAASRSRRRPRAWPFGRGPWRRRSSTGS